MEPRVVKEPRRRKGSESIQSLAPTVPQKEPVHNQSVSPEDAVQARITDRAYRLYAERGYRQGYALDDWLETEKEILGCESRA